MKQDISGIDHEQLACFVNEAYALDIVALSFQPKGEASHSYIAVDGGGTRWVIKVQDLARVVEQEARLRIIRFLHVEQGVTQVIAPRQARSGACACPYQQYMVTVYPFIDGETIEPDHQTNAYVSGFASLLGRFHTHSSVLPFPLPVETFENPDEEPILQALRTLGTAGDRSSPTQDRVRHLLGKQHADIVAALETMRQLIADIGRLHLDHVLIHGDPNWENVLIDRAGVFHLLDWDDLALGPPEHDLVFFSNRPPERFEAFLRQYLLSHGPARLHLAVFAYYWYRDYTGQIAAYVLRLRDHLLNSTDDEQVWAEVGNHVLPSHAEIVAGVRQIEETLTRIASG